MPVASFGREVIYTDAEAIIASNVCDEVAKALAIHAKNRSEIQYLYDYRKGKQPILSRVKEIRPEINNRIVENRADEIVNFKTGYQTAEPCQYVSRGDANVSEAINRLNDCMYVVDKESGDNELVDWFFVCGTAFRMILPREGDDSPFDVFTLDPRDTFAVYSSKLGHACLMAGTTVKRENGQTLSCVYTKESYFEITDGMLTKSAKNELGEIPIIEYPANFERLGAFEVVLPLLDAINTVESNRLDGVEQFIQALLVLKGVEIDNDDFKSLKELGGLLIPEGADASYLVQELNQASTQVLKDDMYQAVLTICGMPNRNGGSSTSDTGAAVTMRDGWSEAESRAKSVEKLFRRSEKQFLRLALKILREIWGIELELPSVGIRCPRRNYENVQEKSQVLTTMLANDKIDPRLAFEHCGLFVDPELAYTSSMQYAEKKRSEEAAELENLEKAVTNASRVSADV